MKKNAFYFAAICLLFTLSPIQLNATTKDVPPTVVSPKPEESAEAEALLLRLNTIDEIDKSTLNSSEKRALRAEVRTIKSELRSNSNGIYLSTGAAIIIVIILIILL